MANENVFLLYALVMGIFITFLYDILRIVRRVFPHGNFLVSLEDLCFWIYCAVEVFLLMYRFSDGMLRWFAVLGALSGMFLYRKLVSPVFVKYASMALGKVKEISGRVLGILFKPFGFLLRQIRHALRRMKVRMRGRWNRSRYRPKGRLKKKLTFLLKVLKMTI